MYENLTYNEFVSKYPKMTKNEVAFYETKFEYRTRMNTEILLEELAETKKELLQTKENILKEIRAREILDKNIKNIE